MQSPRKYQMSELFEMSIKGKSYIGKSRWKGMVKEKVSDREFSEWRLQLVGSERLMVFRSIIHKIEPCIWWQYMRKNYKQRIQVQIVMKVLCGAYSFHSQHCILCYDDMEQKSGLLHIMFDCVELDDMREL